MITLGVLGTVLGASMLGSLHCAGMCGPLATVASNPSASNPNGRTRLPVLQTTRTPSVHYNLGRLAAYVGLGLAAGSAGALLDDGGATLGVQRAAVTLASVTLIAMGLFGLWQGLRSRKAARISGLANQVVRWASRLQGHRGFPTMLGALTGLMPCGWLWAYVVVAGGTGSALEGAAVMATFWLGTVPALAVVGVALGTLGRRAGAHLRWAVPLLMLAAGGLTLATRGAALNPTAEASPDIQPKDGAATHSCH